MFFFRLSIIHTTFQSTFLLTIIFISVYFRLSCLHFSLLLSFLSIDWSPVFFFSVLNVLHVFALLSSPFAFIPIGPFHRRIFVLLPFPILSNPKSIISVCISCYPITVWNPASIGLADQNKSRDMANCKLSVERPIFGLTIKNMNNDATNYWWLTTTIDNHW